MAFPILSSILFCPLIGLALILLTPAKHVNQIRWTALLASAGTLGLSVWLCTKFDITAQGFQQALAIGTS